ncbi:MAG: L-rhamnose isomerase [Promethearchaeota archaeon]
MIDNKEIEVEYEHARRVYAELGVNTDEVISKLKTIQISLHCWQADDVTGFERPDAALTDGGIQATGNYPGKARNINELRQDYLKALSLVPGSHRINLHAIYGEFDGKVVDRNQISIEHFEGWINWAKEHGLGIDFNPTFFSHPNVKNGYTLSSKSEDIRNFWIEHAIKSREIAKEIGKRMGTPCIYNLWIPDGSKDIPVDRLGHRQLLVKSLDKIFSKTHHHDNDRDHVIDAVEGKLFGIGSESYVVGSHDFYLAYCVSRGLALTMDMGHYHPTESVADKISATLPFVDDLLIHVSRGVRWDSDHVAIMNDELIALCEEIIRANALDRIHIALDYFDASINRIAAWIIGMRSTMKSLLYAMLEPHELLKEYEDSSRLYKRLALLESLKSMPFGAVWDYYCLISGVPPGNDWVKEVDDYEKEILAKR